MQRRPRNEEAERKLRSLMPQACQDLLVDCHDEIDGYRFTVWPRGGGQVVGNTLPREDFDESRPGDIRPATAYLLARIEHAFAGGPPPPPAPASLPRGDAPAS